ncbi:N-formylglutamate amidohydrolase [Tistrella bauzanensis]|jgi:N-formylglutamate amidohydrolase|uniref:N-formylglutamate amidohydrolase n=1 Tax=Tistrella arctica TaxID=3133430 RepID=A0ABU9YS56_9PROT
MADIAFDMEDRADAVAAAAAIHGIDALVDPAVEVLRPAHPRLPFVFASPHSGDCYPEGFRDASRLDPLTLRNSEDAFVDGLYGAAPGLGAPLLRARFPRAYVDVNREAYEIDPQMFADGVPSFVNANSRRVLGGLGTIARVVTNGLEIYTRKLLWAEAELRIARYYFPYHAALKATIDEVRSRFGGVLLVDCHSMPSVGGPMDHDPGAPRVDFVLGDRFGAACAPRVIDTAQTTLERMGYNVARNRPYAGGFVTEHYGRPIAGVHALQIEINRALYMDEARLRPLPDFEAVAADIARLIDTMGQDTALLAAIGVERRG